MEENTKYDLEFFLTNDAFVNWVHSGSSPLDTQWEVLMGKDSGIRPVIEQARSLILEWKNMPSQLSDEKLAFDINRILADSSKKDVVRIPSRYTFSVLTKIAAVVFLVIGLAWIVWRQRGVESYSYDQLVQQVESPMTEFSNNLDKDHEIRLPDGSKVVLSKGSRISYSKNLTTDSTRNVYLEGDGFFDVIKDKKHPFLVYSQGLVTRVVGTSFQISSMGTNVSVAVRSGKVAVYRMKEFKETQREDFLLIPNQEAVFVKDQNAISRKLVENPVILEGQDFDYTEFPVSKIFDSLEKAYGIRIVYDAELLKNCTITIPLRGEPFFTKLEILCRTIQAEYKVSDNQVIVSGKGCN